MYLAPFLLCIPTCLPITYVVLETLFRFFNDGVWDRRDWNPRTASDVQHSSYTRSWKIGVDLPFKKKKETTEAAAAAIELDRKK
jgi:hypothetical protein